MVRTQARSALILLVAVAVLFVRPGTAQEKRGVPRLQRVPGEVAKKVKLERIARGLSRPVAVVQPPGDDQRLFVVEQTGKIKILRQGAVLPTPFLDLSGTISKIEDRESEQGLLGLVFHPAYAKNGFFYVNYTDRKDHTHVVEYIVSKNNPDVADPKSAREVLWVEQPYPNHNGGHLAFGTDGKLYVGMGDGGAANDPHGHGQNPKSHLGKMLRLDVDPKKTVKIEILMSGLRNPWRYSFDRKTGDLYIADVGQKAWEEVSVLPAGQLAGKNLGWNKMEGLHCFPPGGRCSATGTVLPVMEYANTREGCSITGGYVYRGKAIPELDGVYFYADYCTALVRSFRYKAGVAVDSWDWRDALDPQHKLARLSSFGEDNQGELYLMSLDGDVYKFMRR